MSALNLTHLINELNHFISGIWLSLQRHKRKKRKKLPQLIHFYRSTHDYFLFKQPKTEPQTPTKQFMFYTQNITPTFQVQTDGLH